MPNSFIKLPIKLFVNLTLLGGCKTTWQNFS
ncbi:hypothetical protein CA2559_11463 [Croceibacter atlanticus HTCC2559]|uniref:Lipoprotein n=1 Tax=Croceibacter atlanticus (strain ATCC BAA-628 / JCM 21780 / CIP 108009 / IAM 15332 / KCTC 12090 / HTCC2559) TaxID=216432 RepID=A3UA15_CROAH|nr:hypothetical protein CA2559_11463 [Croceibacter atlanticus HTCC2559]